MTEQSILEIISSYRECVYNAVDEIMLQAFEEMGEMIEAEGGPDCIPTNGIGGLSAAVLKDVVEHFKAGTLVAFVEGDRKTDLQIAFLQPGRLKMRSFRQKYPKAYLKWTDEEDSELTSMWNDGKSWAELSSHFGRNVNALRIRLTKLGFDIPEARPHW